MQPFADYLAHLQPSRLALAIPDWATPVAPTPLPQPQWGAVNHPLATEMGLDAASFANNAHLALLAGNALPTHGRPVASVYSGHQFGHWAGQLGDGRALLLGDWPTPQGPLEVQLKGAGLTPFSRMGDGRAVLRSSIREFLASEAMHGLGIPTTRALTLVVSPQPVPRESWETAAVVTRVAPSFLRFGHFEHFSYNNRHDVLRALADEVVGRFYPQCHHADHPANRGQPTNPYRALLHEVAQATAELVADWQAVGFCHGVMNTDNMSLLGLTLDYGPFQFMDGFDPHHICNHTDAGGRYAYIRQPQIARWNLFCLAQALLPLIGEPDDALAVLEPFPDRFAHALDQRMAAKLGWPVDEAPAPDALANVRDLGVRAMQLLASQRVDHTLFWHRIGLWVAAGQPLPLGLHPSGQALAELFSNTEALASWLTTYTEQTNVYHQAVKANLMLKTNPKFVLRNHLAQQAIAQAQEGNFGMVQDLLTVLHNPFDPHPAFETWAALPPAWAADIAVSCSS